MKKIKILLFLILLPIKIFSAEDNTEVNYDDNYYESLLQNYVVALDSNIKSVTLFTGISAKSNFLYGCLNELQSILSSDHKDEFLKYISTNEKYKNLNFNNLSEQIHEMEKLINLEKNKIRWVKNITKLSLIISMSLLFYKKPKLFNFIIDGINKYFISNAVIFGLIAYFAIKTL